MGRPPKINPERQQRIVEALLACSTLEAAASYGGICYNTLLAWTKRGDREIERVERLQAESAWFAGLTWKRHDRPARVIEPRPSELPYVEFSLAVKNAVAESEALLIADIRADPDWKSNAWIAERRWPERWARPVRHELSGPGGKPIAVQPARMLDITKLTDEQLDQYEQLALAMADETEE